MIVISAERVETVVVKFQALRQEMDERTCRLWAASEARALGYGGISAVAAATGIAVGTIRSGIRELLAQESGGAEETPRRIRRPGAGRKSLPESDPALSREWLARVESTTRGDPMSPLRWTCKSTRRLATELTRQGHPISHTAVAALLGACGYSLQANRKTREGASHPDRDAQFEHINAKVKACQKRGQPVISVDAKKKEWVGDFKNGGREWHPHGTPQAVRTHDFPDPVLGKAIPYGVYDMTRNHGWVSVGTDHDTAEFAVATIRHGWRQMGHRAYPHAREVLITADSGGSNGSRSRLWKIALQTLADETGLRIRVGHFPPGTSKWNKIEHQMFCHITRNWRGQPLETLGVIVNLIGHTTTEKGLKIKAALDRRPYPKGIQVSDQQMAELNSTKDTFHGDWNYTIDARTRAKRKV